MARKGESVMEEPQHQAQQHQAQQHQAQTEAPPMPAPTPPPIQPPPATATPAAAPATVTPTLGVQPMAIPPLGKTPVSWGQLVPPRNAYAKATHFPGPVVSGSIGSVAAGQPLPWISGSAELAFIFLVDYSMGNFQLPLPLPKGAMPVGASVGNLQAYTVAPTINFGITAGGAEVGALPSPAAVNTFAASNFATGPLPTTGQYYINVAGNAGTAGQLLCAIRYIVPFGQWSGPA